MTDIIIIDIVTVTWEDWLLVSLDMDSSKMYLDWDIECIVTNIILYLDWNIECIIENISMYILGYRMQPYKY